MTTKTNSAIIDEMETSEQDLMPEKGTNEDISIGDAKDYLERDVRLKLAIIGIGNAGNQVVGYAHKAGYHNVYAINSSVKDLGDSVVGEVIPSFIAGNEARGAGKNRKKAKELFRENGKQLFQIKTFTSMIEDADVIIVAAATAGGTGSGIAPELVRLLTTIYPNKIVIFQAIVPKISDSIMAQNNTLQCMNEINEQKIPFMMADLSFFENEPNDIAYRNIANHIMMNLDVIRGKYLYTSKDGMIDENDMRTILAEPGYLSIYMVDHVTADQLEEKSMQARLVERIKKSPATQIARDQIIKQMGVIVNCPDEMMESSRTGNYNELKAYVGEPWGVFENYSVNNSTMGQFIVILSGMNLPYSRILAIKEKLEAHEEQLKRSKQVTLDGDVNHFSFLGESGTEDKLQNNSAIKVDEKRKKSVLDDFFQ